MSSTSSNLISASPSTSPSSNIVKEPSYWDKDPSHWELNDFDLEYVIKNPSSTKSMAHQALASEILLMRKHSNGNTFVNRKLDKLEKRLKKSSKDTTNKKFWKEQKKGVALAAVEAKVADYKLEASVSTYMANAIEKRAKELALSSPRRKHSDDESSGVSNNWEKQKAKESTPVTPTAQLTEFDSKWIVDGVSISEMLLQLRDNLVNNKKHDLSDLRELALSHIFLFSTPLFQWVTQCFDLKQRGKVFDSLSTVVVQSLPRKASKWSKEILDMLYKSDTEPSLTLFKRKTAGWMIEACDDDDEELLMFADILHRSVPKLLSATNKRHAGDTIAHNCVFDLLNIVFGEDQELQHEWVKRRPGSDIEVLMKPDFTAATKPAHRIVYLFSVEINPPSKANDKHTFDNKVKLGEQMKAMLKVLESLEIEDAETCGLLVQGFKCMLYRMDSIYKPVYRMMEIGSFQLVVKFYELLLLPSTVASLLTCKRVVQRSARAVEEHYI